MRALVGIILIGSIPACMLGQTLYRSATTGNWNTASTWEVSLDGGANWSGAASTPTDANCDGITVRDGHTVTVTAGVTVDEVTIDAGGQVTVNGGIGWTIANGTGTDLTINGTVLNSGLALFSSAGPTWVVNSGGTYIHNTTSGIATPLGGTTLNASSNFIYRGSSSLTPAVSVSGRTYGNLTFESTSGGWTASVSGTGTLTINGNFTIGSGVTYSTTQTGVMTFAGDFTNNGTLTNSTGTQVFTFTGSGKTISGAGSITFETWNINAGASISLGRDVSIASTFTGTVSGTLNCGAYLVSGDGNFTLASGATLGIGSAAGITTGSASGNIQVTGTRSFNTGANYTYNGTAAQVTGSGLPSTINNLTNSNTSGVLTTSSSLTVAGLMTVASGTNLRVGGSIALTATGNVTINGELSGGDAWSAVYFEGSTFENNSPVSVASLFFNRAGAQSISGTGSWSCTTLTIGSTNSPTVSLSNALTLNVGTFTVNSGSTLSLGSYDLTLVGSTINNSGTISGTGILKTEGTVTLNNYGTFSPPFQVVTGTTTATGTFGGAITVNSGATLQVAGSSVVTANANVTINGTLSGADPWSSFYFAGSTFTNNSPVSVATFYFDGAGAQNASGTGSWSCTNLYIGSSNSPTVSLSNALTMNVGTLTVSGGRTLSLGSYNLTLVGSSINNSGTISGTGTLQTEGTVTINNYGTFSPPFQVVTGTATATGTFAGAITVNSGATLQVAGSGMVTATANVTINGTLSGADAFSSFYFTGSTFANNSPVSVATFYFDGAGAQSASGTGSWSCTNLYIGSSNSPTVSLSNALTMNVGTITVYSGRTMSLGSYNLTLVGSTINNSGTISGTATLRTEGTVTFNNYGTYTAPLQVVTGTTTTSGTFDNTITIDAGATLQVAGSSTVNANANVTVNGTLSGADIWSTFNFAGSTFTNNSPVTVTNFNFGSGAQTLAGTGTFSSNTAMIPSGSTVTLTANHQMSTVIINFGGSFNITSRTLSLSGSGTPLTNSGTFTTTGSTIVYNGSTAQTVAVTDVDYNNLSIDNAAGVTLGAPETVPGILTLTNGTLSGAANLTLGTGATIVRSAGALSGTPTFGSSVNVEYTGSTAVTSGSEIPVAAGVLNNLTMNKSGGVSLATNATVNGTFTLTAGDFSIGTNTLTLNSTVTRTGGTLSSGASGTVIYNQGSSGQSVISANYGNLTFSDFNKILVSSGTIGIAGTFTPGTATGHTVTGSTVEYNGASAQALPSGFSTYNNLVLNNASGTTGFSGLTVNDLMRVQSGTFTTASTFNNVQIDPGATLAASPGSTIDVQGTWTNNGTFTAGSGTVRFSGSGAQSIGGSSATTFNNLTIDNSSGVSLATNATVNGTLSFSSGKLSLGSTTLTVASSGSVSGASASSYIVTDGTGGLVRTVGATDVLFPIGPTTTSYNPMTLSNSGTSESFTGSVKLTFDVAPLDPTRIVNRQWTINQIGAAVVSVQITFQWLPAHEAGSFVRTNPIYIGRYTGSGWVQTSAVLGGSDPYTATASGFTSFSIFGVGNDAALPVELVSFSGKYRAGNVYLHWETAEEVNHSRFEVERSVTGLDWEQVATVFSQPDDPPSRYSFIDTLSLTLRTYPTLFYRLKQVDRDGTFEYSPMIRVFLDNAVAEDLVESFPNPVQSEAVIRFTLPFTQRVNLTVHNVLGQEILRLLDQSDREGGIHTVRFIPKDLPAGMYFIHLATESGISMRPLILKR